MIGEAGTTLGYPEFKAFAYETLAEGKPTDKAILNSLAEAYMEAKDAAKAEKTYERILEIDPRDGDALSGLKNASAANASKVGKWDTATDYREILKSKTESEQLEQEAKVVKSADAIEEQIAPQLRKSIRPSRPTRIIPRRSPSFSSRGTTTAQPSNGTSMPSKPGAGSTPPWKKSSAISG